jgi:hypothetical protein
MNKNYTALISGILLLGACGDNATTPPATADAGTPRGDGGGFGTLTPMGPRVSGTRTGMVQVGSTMGAGYDLDGDGDAEEIDVDGDGISDGEDIDGDGVITIWEDLRVGDRAPTEAERALEMPSTDPDNFARLDPMFVSSNRAPDGTITAPASVLNTMPANLLRARSQGGQGSCAAWTVGAAATLVRQRYETASMPMINADAFWASPSWLYARMVRDGMSTCNEGTSITTGLDHLITTGAATLAEQPYRSGTMPMLCETIDDTTARTPHVFRIAGYTSIAAGATFRARVRDTLAAGLPVVFGANLPDGFMEYRATAAGTAMPFRGTGMCTGSNHCGGHGMVIVGYDDARSAYRVLNSWGTDWGDQGYVWWDYAALEGLTNLHAHAILPLTTAPGPLAAPNAAGFTVTQPTGSQPVLAQEVVSAGEAARWTLTVRVQFSEPFTVTRLDTDIDSNVNQLTLSTAMSYGDLQFRPPGTDMPAANQMATLTIVGKLRDDTEVTRTLMVTVPAPTARP